MVIWLVAGAILCLVEFFLPTAFVAFMMGISALIIALLSLVVPQVYLQAVLWLGLSILLVLLSRRFIPRRKIRTLQDPAEATTLTEIEPGGIGRVLCEGYSWQARCEDQDQAIAPNQRVYVVRREGTTLFVVPVSIVHS